MDCKLRGRGFVGFVGCLGAYSLRGVCVWGVWVNMILVLRFWVGGVYGIYKMLRRRLGLSGKGVRGSRG